MRRLPIFLLPLFRPNARQVSIAADTLCVYCAVDSLRCAASRLSPCVTCAQAYYLPTSVAVTGLAKTAVCFGASLSLFAALVAHKVAPQPLPLPVPRSLSAEAEGAGE
jgi:hypothetical protein